MKNALLSICTAVFVAVIAIETVIDRHTGHTLPALKNQRERRGRRLQNLLNLQHGTAIRYGYISGLSV